MLKNFRKFLLALYKGRVDECYDFLLRYEKYFEQYVNLESVTIDILGSIAIYNQIKFMKYVLLKVRKENRFKFINSTNLVIFIIYNNLEIADLIVEEFKDIDDGYNQHLSLIPNYEMKKESIDYMIKLIDDKILVLNEKSVKILKQHAIDSKNEYLLEKIKELK